MVTRRGIIKGAVIAGVAALGGATIAGALRPFLPPPGPVSNRVEEGFIYANPIHREPPQPEKFWFEPLEGRVALASDFTGLENGGVGFGAGARWRTQIDSHGQVVGGTGSPALIMRLDPARVVLPPGLGETVAPDGFVAVFSVDPFLCCGHAFNFARTKMFTPSPAEDILIRNPSAVVAPDIGVIVDLCHWDQYDPSHLVWDVHPHTGTRYLGAKYLSGPSKRALPVIPVDASGDKLVGLNTHPDWYRGYCGL